MRPGKHTWVHDDRTAFGQIARRLQDAHEEDCSVMFGFGTASGEKTCADNIMNPNNKQLVKAPSCKPVNRERKATYALPRLSHS